MSTTPDENPGGAEVTVFDPARIAMLLEMDEDGDTSMVKEIAAQFVVDINGVLERIEAAIQSGAFAQVVPGAHTIKGSAATFGLFQVEKIAKEMESAGKDPAKHGDLPAIFESLRAAFAAGKTELEAYLAEK